MKTFIHPLLLVLVVTLSVSCGNAGKKEKDGSLNDKKARLEKLKNERNKLDGQITSLQEEIAKIDTSMTTQKPQLVGLTNVKAGDFKHYLDLQGAVDDKNVSYITPSGQPGQIKAILVKQGDRVRKGQLVLKLDNSVAAESVNAVKQQMASVEAQLGLAKSVYQRQKNLWEQNIGTEVQLLQAKTNVETLEGQLKAIKANVQTAQSQANQANVYSDVNGTIDEITAKVGETFTGNPMQGGYIKVVTNSDTKISVTIPESYISQVQKGTPVIVTLPDVDKEFTSKITFLSQTIGANTRGFVAEVAVPSNVKVRPNQIAKVQILDYQAPNSIAVPLNTLQTDEEGKYIMVAAKHGNDLIAEKRRVVPGTLYGDKIEIKQGLKEGDEVITEGYQGLFEGQLLTTGI